ncbi:MAG TPA: hypothetical protein VE620_03355 [Myxococcales bacterium]|jgi:hypothetical protein|nr:hypothetical protein [Myxococcales bacterium]
MNSMVAAARRLADDINARLDPASKLLVTENTIELYQSMTRPTLLILRAAFIADRDQNRLRRQTAAFCQSRIDLIDRLLAEGRKETGRT